MKKILLAIFLTLQLPVYAQNRVTDFLELSDESFPVDMPKTKGWITQNLSKIFLSSVQFSNNLNRDSKFLSFAILGNDVNGLPLSNTGGVQLRFHSVIKPPRYRSGTISCLYTKEINAYRTGFDVNNFHFLPKEYFLLTAAYLRLTDDQAVANTLNHMDFGVPNKFKQFVKDVNLQMKTKIAAPAGDNMRDLMPLLKAQFKDSIIQVIYYTYIKSKTPALTSRKMNDYFAIAVRDNVMFKIDDMINPKIDISFAEPETLILPATILAPQPDSAANFKTGKVKVELDYKKRELRLVFSGKFEQPVKVVNGKYKDYTVKKGFKLITPKPGQDILKGVASITYFISEKGVRTEASSPDEGDYQLFSENWK